MTNLLPGVSALVAAYDKRTWHEIDAAHFELTKRYGLVPLLPLMISACAPLKSWKARKTLLFYLLPHARDYPALVDLALALVNDRARMVREEALGIIAYSLEVRALAPLRQHLDHPDPETRAAVIAAIEAIERQDHNLFLDRDHTGNVQWLVRAR
jgi:hypothetical protein